MYYFVWFDNQVAKLHFIYFLLIRFLTKKRHKIVAPFIIKYFNIPFNFLQKISIETIFLSNFIRKIFIGYHRNNIVQAIESIKRIAIKLTVISNGIFLNCVIEYSSINISSKEKTPIHIWCIRVLVFYLSPLLRMTKPVFFSLEVLRGFLWSLR